MQRLYGLFWLKLGEQKMVNMYINYMRDETCIQLNILSDLRKEHLGNLPEDSKAQSQEVIGSLGLYKEGTSSSNEKKTTITFRYTGCLIGIPIMGYNKPYNKGSYNPYTT